MQDSGVEILANDLDRVAAIVELLCIDRVATDNGVLYVTDTCIEFVAKLAKAEYFVKIHRYHILGTTHKNSIAPVKITRSPCYQDYKEGAYQSLLKELFILFDKS